MLPAQYILHRWTKYAKRGFFCEKQKNKNETSKARAARISQKATSIALKCSVSDELLDDLEKAIDKLDLEADNSLSQRPTKSCEVLQSSSDYVGDILKGKVSIRVPPVKKGPKTKRERDPLEKNKGKTRKAAKKKGTNSHFKHMSHPKFHSSITSNIIASLLCATQEES